jgi:exosome complex RNA-binding protein Rrp42 (RNase PH superfamily)
MKKPVAHLIGKDGNIFNLVSIASKALKNAGMYDSAKEMQDKVFNSNSYYEALSIIGDYVEIR